MKRTHFCGELRLNHENQACVITGWVHKRRDHGNLVFIDIRDYTGLVQVVIGPNSPPAVRELSHDIRREFVCAVEGRVMPRAEGMANPDMPTGAIEIVAEELIIYSRAATPPLDIEDDARIEEPLRLEYRYLDLRRPFMQKLLRFRHRLSLALSNYLDEHGFVEVETPVLTRSTPEGARDYLVPSRVQKGRFFALPQSPQLFKQILMVSGFDRYFQIAKCFRDEDLRADRQPEFTQLDMEMSFVAEDDVLEIVEGLVASVFDRVLGVTVSRPFNRMPYREAMERYGSDKPDTRFALELGDITGFAAECSFPPWRDCVAGGGVVKTLTVPGAADDYSRKKLDSLTALAKKHGARGLFWLKKTADGFSSSFAKKLTEREQESFINLSAAGPGDLVLAVADTFASACIVLGELRLHLARKTGRIPEDPFPMEDLTPDWFRFLWVVDFPLLDYSEDDGRFYAQHHPFTAPREDDLPMLDTDPGACRARAYDLVLNGIEIAGGSIRISNHDLQKRMFDLLGISPAEAESRFGFLLKAFRYGVPPHGGIAFGLERLIMAMRNISAIRDLIAFPKTTTASCLMTGAPSPVDDGQLKELGLQRRPSPDMKT